MPSLLHIRFAHLAHLHHIARGEHQVIKCPTMIEEVTNVLLIREINRMALRPFGKECNGTINALASA